MAREPYKIGGLPRAKANQTKCSRSDLCAHRFVGNLAAFYGG